MPSSVAILFTQCRQSCLRYYFPPLSGSAIYLCFLILYIKTKQRALLAAGQAELVLRLSWCCGSLKSRNTFFFICAPAASFTYIFTKATAFWRCCTRTSSLPTFYITMCCVHEKDEEDLLEQGARMFLPAPHQSGLEAAHEKTPSIHSVTQIYKDFSSPPLSFPKIGCKNTENSFKENVYWPLRPPGALPLPKSSCLHLLPLSCSHKQATGSRKIHQCNAKYHLQLHWWELC